jgi:hypothetical protein
MGDQATHHQGHPRTRPDERARQAKIAREDQAEDILNGREQPYKACVSSAGKHRLTTDDRAELRQELETSMRKAQDAMQIMDAQGGVSPDVKGLRGKLVVLATLPESDLMTLL